MINDYCANLSLIISKKSIYSNRICIIIYKLGSQSLHFCKSIKITLFSRFYLLIQIKNLALNREKSAKPKESTDQFSRENSYGAYIELKQSRADKFPSLDQWVIEGDEEYQDIPEEKARKNNHRNHSKKLKSKIRKLYHHYKSFRIDRKFWFNENKLREFLDKYNLPLWFNNIRILKEHAASVNDEKIDMKPALMIIAQQYPKVMKK